MYIKYESAPLLKKSGNLLASEGLRPGLWRFLPSGQWSGVLVLGILQTGQGTVWDRCMDAVPGNAPIADLVALAGAVSECSMGSGRLHAVFDEPYLSRR
jgi:hypothetical protein